MPRTRVAQERIANIFSGISLPPLPLGGGRLAGGFLTNAADGRAEGRGEPIWDSLTGGEGLPGVSLAGGRTGGRASGGWEAQDEAESRVGDLPLQNFQVALGAEGAMVDRAFRASPNLVGVMVQEGGCFRGLISRRKFYEMLGRQFGVAIFLHRPVQVMLEAMQLQNLVVPESHPVAETVRLALARPVEDLYEPVLVQHAGDEYSLLDIYTLLLAQTKLLAAMQGFIQRANEELERRVDLRTNELQAANTRLEQEIIEKRRAEGLLEVRLRYERTLNLCANTLLTGGDSQGIIQKTIGYLIQAVGTGRVFVLENYEHERLGLCLKLRNQVSARQTAPLPARLSLFPYQTLGDWLNKLWLGKRIIGQIEAVGSRDREMMQELGIVSLLLIPIGEVGHWLGAIGFGETQTERAWDEDEIELLYTVAQMLYAYLERRRNALALAEARDEALRASAFKSELLAKVSHELRTPLGAILGYAQLLHYGSYGALSAEQQEATGVVIGSTKYLATLVDGILDQAQLENGQLSLAFQRFTVRQMAEEVETRIRVLAESKGLEFVVTFAPGAPAEMWGDRLRIEQVLTNLLGNAVKFTESGRVAMRLAALAAAGGDWLSIQISDTGEGIPKEAQERIFEPFQQVDGSLTRSQGGAGLGLSISKQLVERMGGRIRLESEVGQGSAFTVELPAYNDPAGRVQTK